MQEAIEYIEKTFGMKLIKERAFSEEDALMVDKFPLPVQTFAMFQTTGSGLRIAKVAITQVENGMVEVKNGDETAMILRSEKITGNGYEVGIRLMDELDESRRNMYFGPFVLGDEADDTTIRTLLEFGVESIDAK